MQNSKCWCFEKENSFFCQPSLENEMRLHKRPKFHTDEKYRKYYIQAGMQTVNPWSCDS